MRRATSLQFLQNDGGELLVSAVEVMRTLQCHHLNVRTDEPIAQRIAIVLAPHAENVRSEPVELRLHRQAGGIVVSPVDEMKFELDSRTWPEQRDETDLRLQVRRNPIDHRGQDVGAA